VTLSWLSCDAKTGVVLADLPDLAVDKVSRSICRYDSTTATLPVPTAPDNFELATRPGGAVMILLSDDQPIWGGLVTQRTRGSGDTVALALATLESYFDRRFVGDVTYAATGQNAIAADLATRYVAAGSRGGIPIRVVMIGGAGMPRDRTYLDADDKSVYSALNELAALDTPIEYTIGWEHQSSPERYTPVLYVGSRIGAAVMTGMAPTATFDLPGCITDALETEDYSAGSGANDVMAVSTATSGTRPQSAHHLAPDDGRPTYAARVTPSTSIIDVPTLDAHAAGVLAVMAGGATSLALSASVMASGTKPAAPILGTDWNLGDSVGFDLTAPAFPSGLVGTQRAIGWEMTLGVTPLVTPILVAG
jgi:hypothetical protein